jgi:uncharacterized protein YggE
MNTRMMMGALVLVAGLVLPGLVQRPGVSAQPQMPAETSGGSITVTGNAQMRVVPDEVVFTLGVETSDKNLTTARQQNDQIIRKVMEVTRKYGIPNAQVQTDYINIEPRYDSSYRQSEFIGYFVTRNVVITLRDLAKFEAFYADVLGVGVNYVNGIQFRTTDLRKYRDQARALAIQAAREKAAAMAGGLGQELGAPRSINENGISWWSGYNSWWGGRSNMMVQNVIQNSGPSSSLPEDSTLAPGQIEVQAEVSVTFDFAPKAAQP